MSKDTGLFYALPQMVQVHGLLTSAVRSDNVKAGGSSAQCVVLRPPLGDLASTHLVAQHGTTHQVPTLLQAEK